MSAAADLLGALDRCQSLCHSVHPQLATTSVGEHHDLFIVIAEPIRQRCGLHARRECPLPQLLPDLYGESTKIGRVVGGTLALFQIQCVVGEHLLRAHQARQDLLVVGELDHCLERLAIARQTIGEWIIPYQAAAL